MGKKEDIPNKDTKTILDKLVKQFGSDKVSGFGEYTQDMQVRGHVPDNPFAHAHMLINPSHKDTEKDGFDVLSDPQILLGFIEDSKTLRLFQKDLELLAVMCGMAQRSGVFSYVFPILWNATKINIRVTSAMDGTERYLQAFHITGTPSKRKGFGILKKGKKKREPIEYIIPEGEEEQGIY
jgi:hypothetical protein